MTDKEIISAIDQTPVKVSLSFGDFSVKPLTVRRLSKLTGLLRGIQGDTNKFKDVDSPEFYDGITEMIAATGDKIPEVLAVLTGEDALGKIDDISILDLSNLVLASAQANQASKLITTFQKAKEAVIGKIPS